MVQTHKAEQKAPYMHHEQCLEHVLGRGRYAHRDALDFAATE